MCESWGNNRLSPTGITCCKGSWMHRPHGTRSDAIVIALIVLLIVNLGITHGLVLDVGVVNLSSTKWVTVRFSKRMTNPVVFVSPPHIETDNAGMVLVGKVTRTSFQASVYFPSCAQGAGTGSSAVFKTRWLAVQATARGYFDNSEKVHVDWTAAVTSVSGADASVAGLVLENVDEKWTASETPAALLQIQNQREIMQQFASAREYMNAIIVTRIEGNRIEYRLQNSFEWRPLDGRELNIGIFRYNASLDVLAILEGVTFQRRVSTFHAKTVLPVEVPSIAEDIPAVFALQRSANSDAPQLLVLRETSEKETVQVSLVALDDCRELFTSVPHTFELTYVFRRKPTLPSTRKHTRLGGPSQPLKFSEEAICTPSRGCSNVEIPVASVSLRNFL